MGEISLPFSVSGEKKVLGPFSFLETGDVKKQLLEHSILRIYLSEAVSYDSMPCDHGWFSEQPSFWGSETFILTTIIYSAPAIWLVL